MGELVQIDDISQKIRERIQAEFVSLVPQETWHNLVKTEIEWFVTQKSDRYRNKSETAPLSQLIREELQARFKADIQEALNEMNPTNWNGALPKASDGVKEMVKELAPDLVQLAFQDIVQRAIEGIRNQLSLTTY